jgi:hypothetical protein
MEPPRAESAAAAEADSDDAPPPDPAAFVGPLTASDHAEVLECARYGEAANLRYLLAIGCDPNTRDASGATALHKAAANGLVPILELLAGEGGAGAAFVANASGNTPLHFACLTGQREAAAWLLRRFGAAVDVFAKNKAGKSAFTEATTGGHEEIARMLLDHSAASGGAGGGRGGGAGAGAGAGSGGAALAGGGENGGSNASAAAGSASAAAHPSAGAGEDAEDGGDAFGEDDADVEAEDEDLVDEGVAEAAAAGGGLVAQGGEGGGALS